MCTTTKKKKRTNLYVYLFVSVNQKDTRGRVTRRVLTGSGLLKETEVNDDDDTNDQTDSPKNDFWNLSNDEYYNPRLVDSVGKNLGSFNLQVIGFCICNIIHM